MQADVSVEYEAWCGDKSGSVHEAYYGDKVKDSVRRSHSPKKQGARNLMREDRRPGAMSQERGRRFVSLYECRGSIV
jgi:hypothetical protein